MKRLIAVILAIVLAFVIALGDELMNLNIPEKGFAGVMEWFGKDRQRPKIPQLIDINKPIEENLTYEERLKKGAYYYDRGFLSFAVNEYVKAANLEPAHIEPYERLMTIHFEMLNYDKARTNAETVLKLNPGHLDAHYFLVLAAIRLSEFDEASQLIGNLEGQGVNNMRLTYLRALLSIASNQHEAGKDHLKAIIKTDSSADEDLIKKANAILTSYEEYEFAQAAEELYLAELLARAFNQVGEYELAVYKLKDILKTRSDLRDAWILLGFAYLNLEKYLFAVTALETAYDLDPQWPATQYFLGTAYSELNQKEDAIVYLNYALSNGFEPRLVIHQKLADLYLETENYQKSVNAYEQVLEENKQDINAFVRPIWIYLDFLNEPVKALKLAELAMLTFPAEPMSFNLLGWAQAGMGNYVEAEKNLKKAITDDPKLAAAHYNLGRLYEQINQEDQALTSYEQAYQLDQNGSVGNLAAKRYNAILTDQDE